MIYPNKCTLPVLLSFLILLIAVGCGKNTHTVTPQPGSNGTMSPATPQSVNHNAILSFTIEPAPGYGINSVTGCGGTLLDSTYTTAPVTANCIVSATFNVAVQDAQTMFNQNNKSVVVVAAYDSMANIMGQGSGFVVGQDGIIATNYHVIDGAHGVLVKQGNQVLHVKRVINADEENDVAMVEVDATNLPTVRLGDLDRVNIGEKVYVIGSPRGLENTISDGILSGMRTISVTKKFLQITAPISPGSSGGPVFNKNGEVIGIATALMKDAQNINFAVPVDVLKGMIARNGAGQSSTSSSFQGLRPKQVNNADKTVKGRGLFVAVHKGNLSQVKALIEAGADINARYEGGWTVLLVACQEGHTDVVKALIAGKADVNARKDDGTTALLKAAMFENTDVVKALIAAGADVNARNNDGDTALLIATVYNRTEMAQALIAAKADVNARNKYSMTPLMHMSASNNIDVVKALIAAKADVNARSDNGRTALQLAQGHTAIVNLLKRAGAKE